MKWILLALSLCSCATEGPREAKFDINTCRTVAFQRQPVPVPSRYRKEIEEVLQEHSFVIVTNGAADLICTARVDSGWSLTAEICLLQPNGQRVMSASRTNPGFGVWLNHDIVERSQMHMAMDEMDRWLAKHKH